MNNFGAAVPKYEGACIRYDEADTSVITSPEVETIYVERRVPEHLEDEAHAVLDAWLKSKGYNAEEL